MSAWRWVTVGMVLACAGCGEAVETWDPDYTASLFIDPTSRAVACLSRSEDRPTRPACMQVVDGFLSEAPEFMVAGKRTPRLGYRGDSFLLVDGTALTQRPLSGGTDVDMFDEATSFWFVSTLSNGEWIAAGLTQSGEGRIEVSVGSPTRGIRPVADECLGTKGTNPALLPVGVGFRIVETSEPYALSVGGTICSTDPETGLWRAIPFTSPGLGSPAVHVGYSANDEPLVLSTGPDQLRTVAVGSGRLSEVGTVSVAELGEVAAAAAPGGAWVAYSRGEKSTLAVRRIDEGFSRFSSETTLDEGPLVPKTMVTAGDGATWLLAVNPEQLAADEPPMVLFRFNGRQWERYAAPEP